LRRDPTDADIIAAWKAGNLPEFAASVWPELNLKSIPINGFDENLFGLTDQQIIQRLRDHTKALSAAELEWLSMNYPRSSSGSTTSGRWTTPCFCHPARPRPATRGSRLSTAGS
jgi:hypothetical protein